MYSEPCKGATFHVYLPRIDKSPEPPGNLTAESFPKGTEHILLVDDEETIARLLKRMLKRLGLPGHGANQQCGSAAGLPQSTSQPEKFDLVVTDPGMPNMSGTDLAGALLGIRPDIPIVLCTGFSETISKEKALAVGIREHIMKPVVPSQLAETIRRVLDQETSTVA